MFRRKNTKTAAPQKPKTSAFLVPRVEIVAALARASYDGDQRAIQAAERLLRKCDRDGANYLAF